MSVSVSRIWKATAEKRLSFCSGPALPRAGCPPLFPREGRLPRRHWVRIAPPRWWVWGSSEVFGRAGSWLLSHPGAGTVCVSRVSEAVGRVWTRSGLGTGLGVLVSCRDFTAAPALFQGRATSSGRRRPWRPHSASSSAPGSRVRRF